MNLRTAILGSALLFLAMPVLAREHTDVIVMKNGDRLTGEVKVIEALYIDLDYVDGTMPLYWSKVTHLESSQRFIVSTQDGSVYSGMLNSIQIPLGQTLEVRVAETAEEEVTLEGSRITKLTETTEKSWQRMSGAVNFGTTYSKGNQLTQDNLSSETEYLRERWQAQADFASNLSASPGANASTRNRLQFGTLRLLPWRTYFYSGLGSVLQDHEQGIKIQTNLGIGIGRYLKNTDHVRLSVLAGMAWQNTAYQPSTVPIARQNVGASMIAANLKAFVFKRTNLIVNAYVFPAVSKPGRVFLDTNATYYIKVVGNLSWNVSSYGNWDNQPPGKLSGSDYGESSGLSWTFGNR